VSSYELYLLQSVASFRARYVERMKVVADYVEKQTQYGVDKTVVCYQLSALYNQVASLLADIEATGFDIAKYVATRLVSRLEQVETSSYLSYSLYVRGVIAPQIYAYLSNALNAEGYAVYFRYRRFEKLLSDALADLYTAVIDTLSYIGQKMSSVCGG